MAVFQWKVATASQRLWRIYNLHISRIYNNNKIIKKTDGKGETLHAGVNEPRGSAAFPAVKDEKTSSNPEPRLQAKVAWKSIIYIQQQQQQQSQPWNYSEGV